MAPDQSNRYLRKRSPFNAYLRAGLLLHGITLLELAVLAAVGPDLVPFRAESAAGAVFNGGVLVFLFSLPILSQLDARSRFQSYKRVKDNFLIYGFDPRLLRPFIKSRCQRDAVLAAADELGYKNWCRSYFHSQGYRWYHILPDFVFTNPAYLLSPRFWQATFFSKTYHPKTGV